MNYDIKIVGEEEDNGQIEFDRLASLARSTKDIASKALMLQLRGYSDIVPDKNLKKALNMYLQQVDGDVQKGTALTIDCKDFSSTIKGLQLDVFKPREELLHLTPMALVIHSFHTAMGDAMDADIDKPLLKSLVNFKKNFISDNEIFYLANRGTIAEVKLTKDDFQKLEVLEERIPEPQNVLINGQLDEMKISKGKLGLVTKDGLINLVVKEETAIKELLEYMGKDITIKGKAHYRSNGNVSIVEITDFKKPATGDEYFSALPNAKSVQQQLFMVAKAKPKSNSFEALKSLSGIMKDDLSDQEFQEMIKDAHR